jgi:hypothetical protein
MKPTTKFKKATLAVKIKLFFIKHNPLLSEDQKYYKGIAIIAKMVNAGSSNIDWNDGKIKFYPYERSLGGESRVANICFTTKEQAEYASKLMREVI